MFGTAEFSKILREGGVIRPAPDITAACPALAPPIERQDQAPACTFGVTLTLCDATSTHQPR